MTMAPEAAAPTPAPAEPPKAPTLDEAKQLVDQYHVPMHDDVLKKLVGDLGKVDPTPTDVSRETPGGPRETSGATGSAAPEPVHPGMSALENYLKQVSSGLYPGLASSIQAGMKPAYLLEPYRQIAKQVLGPDFEPNFQSDPKMRAALQGGRDAQGRPTPMSLDEWMTHLKSDPGINYHASPQGQQEIADAKVRIVQAMRGGQ